MPESGIDIRCRVGVIGSPPPVPPLRAFGQSLRDIFRDGSRRDIRLSVDKSRQLETVGFGGLEVDSLSLHRAAAHLNRGASNTDQAQTIALLFAGYYSRFTSAFGIMFDRGFRTNDDPYGDLEAQRVPREACAVFLGAIAARRSDDGDGETPYQREAVYTAVHELGHLFNLLHSSGSNFMSGNAGDLTDDEGAFAFSEPQQSHLSACSMSPTVRPRGYTFLNMADESAFRRRRPEPRGPLELRVSLGRAEAHRIDPFELDIEVRLRDGEQRSISVPRTFDPGYPEFRIFIEEPTGEVRLYRSPRHYCWHGKRITLRPGAGFTRDISIFGESGGYTFRMPGHHRVFAEWSHGRHHVRSPPVDFEILPDQHRGPVQRHLQRAAVARFLYHRYSPRGSHIPRLTEDLLAAYPDFAACGSVAYALGRFYVERARQCGDEAARRNRRRGLEWLRRAIDDEYLGAHARALATGLVRSAAEGSAE